MKKNSDTALKKHIKPSLMVGLSVLAFMARQSALAQTLTLSCPQDLSFGNFTAGTCAANVTIDPSGSRVVGACVGAGGAPFSNARCNISQSFPFTPVQLTVPGVLTLNNTGSTSSMSVTCFQLVSDTGGCANNSVTTTTAFATIPVGATLNIKANQPGGTYTGNFTVTANFI